MFDAVDKPPMTVPGDAVTDKSATGLTVRVSVLMTPLWQLAVMVTTF